MKKTDLIKIAEKSVQAVETNLAQLDSHTAEAARLQAEIADLEQSEKEILASDKTADRRLKPLLEVRAKRDLTAADLDKVTSAIALSKKETIQSAIVAYGWLVKLKDGITVSRRERIGSIVKAHFVEQAHLELDRFLPYANLVREIELIEHLVFVPSVQPEMCLSNARKLSARLGLFIGFAATEPADLEIIA